MTKRDKAIYLQLALLLSGVSFAQTWQPVADPIQSVEIFASRHAQSLVFHLKQKNVTSTSLEYQRCESLERITEGGCKLFRHRIEAALTNAGILHIPSKTENKEAASSTVIELGWMGPAQIAATTKVVSANSGMTVINQRNEATFRRAVSRSSATWALGSSAIAAGTIATIVGYVNWQKKQDDMDALGEFEARKRRDLEADQRPYAALAAIGIGLGVLGGYYIYNTRDERLEVSLSATKRSEKITPTASISFRF